MILKGSVEPLPRDIFFDDSPETGSRECLCSRCAEQIQEGEMAIRVWTTNKKGKVDKKSKEYRYCEMCTTGKKYFYCKSNDAFGYVCNDQCEECKNSQ